MWLDSIRKILGLQPRTRRNRRSRPTPRRRTARPQLEILEDRFAPSATVLTDKPDYAFGATAHISGSGFTPGETVQLQVTHAPGTPGSNLDAQNQPWTVTADTSGQIGSQWQVNDPDALGATYILTATGLAGGEVATYQFADASTQADLDHLANLDPTVGNPNN